MTFRVICLMAALAFLMAAPYCANSADVSAEGGRELISADNNGNRTYIEADSLERLDGSIVRVTMIFLSAKTGSEMYFVDEIDCKRGLIKRLSVSLKGPPCTGGIDYDSSFEGEWDKISTGLEEELRDAVCAERGKHPET